MEIDEIISGINAALSNRVTGRRWVSQFILSSMSSDALEYAVENNVDPWAAVVGKYHLDDPRVAFLARGLIRDYWNGRGGIEDTLTSVRKVYIRLAQNPANRELLRRPETIDWLNRAVSHCYNKIYGFAWES